MTEFDELSVEPIAIVGMSCRFPKADNINSFWENLETGKESLTFFSNEELLASGAEPDLVNDPNYVKAGCIIDNMELFDYTFFGYSKEDASLIDPQQRFFLECAYEALEDAGYCPDSYDEPIGLFGGVKTSGYSKILAPLLKRPGTLESFLAVLGTAVDQACLRVSHGLNLKGPSIGVQTACSASIVASHMACESLRNNECEMALAGACALNIPQRQGFLYEEDMITSPDGHCRAFDANAKGTASGNGAGVVVLKRLSDALSDRNNIYAVIRGSAVNNDGAAKVKYIAPSLEGQQSVIEEAILMSEVDVESISYVEGNGTGTFLGDSMEIEALTRAYRTYTEKEYFCGLGSVKTNIGHLTQAAGIAGLIKTALALKNKVIPPSLNYNDPNPQLKNSPFYIMKEGSKWEKNGSPRRAGINSFAIGGTNAHMVLEEAPNIRTKNKNSDVYVFTISAKSEKAVATMKQKYINFLESDENNLIGDICFTSNISRSYYQYRYATIVDSKEKLITDLKASFDVKKRLKNFYDSGRLAFIFSSSFDCTSFDFDFFFNKFLSFKECIKECCDVMAAEAFNYNESLSLRDIVTLSNNDKNMISFIIQYSISKMFESWGIEIKLMAGSGAIGSLTAACVAGIFSVEDSLKLVSFLKNKTLQNNYNSYLDKINFQESEKELLCTCGLETKNQKDLVNKKFWADIFLSTEESNNYDFTTQIKEYSFILISNSEKNILNSKINEAIPQKVLISFYQGNSFEEICQFLIAAYCQGEVIDWTEVLQDKVSSIISLPTYPFEKKYCWFDHSS